MIQIQSLSHRYEGTDVAALQNVSLDIRPGECWGLLGHNGAGKTTLMSLLAGLQEVQQGQVLFDGVEVGRLARAERQKIGLVPQDFAFYPQLSVWDNLLFFASLYGVKDKAYLQSLLDKAGLENYCNRAAKQLSGGLKRRLNFAIGLVNRPQLVFLDEITVGIDPQSRRFILESVADLTRAGITVVYTSHYLPEIEQLCSHIALLDKGKLVYQGSLADLLQAQEPGVRFMTEPAPDDAVLQQWQAKDIGRNMWEAAATTEQAAALYGQLRQSGVEIRYFQQGYGSLEAFYLDFLRRTAA
ncbi:ABC transporter ATP-binding protein [Neisseria wadsworthii]|uniref:ABC superfamily ATP binding cassette transporter, ABC protein n=1 Tax=Neisseria wadsworthii 9715 TaxID=1030841 RepID=G4CQC0_9NEIS|nr:ABC transporter ATP-binding protein [Neisseria wadsworthii]EGZ46525.1 ABC superfamily ATP binding cassette transporter, ABC protein [Neisseria wadsworthii 9715]QMT35039.1 ABC transporter ATP-binding protein [Neisseria wadsworthii]